MADDKNANNNRIKLDNGIEDLQDNHDKKINVISAENFLALTIPKRKHLLSPWLPSQGIAMIHAKRGTGKTFFTLSVACAVAYGGKILDWQAAEPTNVLYIDGEMPAIVMKERLASIISNFDYANNPGRLQIITPDLLDGFMPDLSTPAGQKAIFDIIEENQIKLVIVDNVSCLMPSIKENDADSWNVVQGWELEIRKRGVSIIRVQHTGKSDRHRGSSKHEDIVDTTIYLKQPENYDPADGACFEVIFEKNRSFYGQDALGFEAQLKTNAKGDLIWIKKDKTQSLDERIIECADLGLSQREICLELGLKKSNLCKIYNRLVESGQIKKKITERKQKPRRDSFD